MLYLAIPAHNEVATIGVLLWRIRTVLAEFPREYEVVVYDDASTDATADVASQYEQAMPVTVLRGERHLGYAGAVDLLLRHVAQLTRYPRRDAVLLLQGDFTDPPGIVPEFARRFEGGADLVVGERMGVADAPVAVRRLFKAAQWAMRPFVRVEGVKDTTASMRLVRISALRDALRAVGDRALVTGDSWTTNADLLLRLAPHARRVEAVPMEPTYGVRLRETRRIAMRDALSALKWAWGARGRRAVVGSSAEPLPESERRAARGAGRRREETPELSVDRLREKIRERDGSSGIDGEPEKPRGRRGRDQRSDRERPTRPDRPEAPRPERPARGDRPDRAPRADRGASNSDPAAAPRRGDRDRPRERDRAERPQAPRPETTRAETTRPETTRADAARSDAAPAESRPPKPRGERPARPRREEARADTSAELLLDDPFAPPAPKVDPLARVLEAPGNLDAADTDRPSPAPNTPDAPIEADSQSAPARDAHRDRQLAGAEAPADAAGESSADADPAEEEGDAEGDVPAGEEGEARRRRRRNRRSRRGRKKREGASAEGEGGTEAPVDGAADGAGTEAPAPSRRARRDRDLPPLEGEPVERSASGAGDEANGNDEQDDDGRDDDADDGAARARRRGRRGRRGGARRSRGRRDRARSDEGEGGDRERDREPPDATDRE